MRGVVYGIIVSAVLWVLLFGVVYTCRAEPDYGFDTLAGALYPETVKSIPKKYGYGIFAITFTDSFKLNKEELEDGRSWIRVDLLWSDNHSYGDSDIPQIKRLSKKYEPLCKRYKDRIGLAPFTEHNLKEPDKYLDAAQKEAPDCQIINSVWNGSLSKKYRNEVHGNHWKPDGVYLYSYDGTDAVDSNVERIKHTYASADKFLFWTGRYNCRWSMQDSRSRLERIRDCAKPTKEYQKSIEYLVSNKGIVSIPKNWLVKSHAESHGANDPKGDHLLVISPVKGNAVILKKEGNVVAKLPYYGSYQGDGYRYYYNDFGFHLGAGLNLFLNGTRYGTINGGFRDGSYRD